MATVGIVGLESMIPSALETVGSQIEATVSNDIGQSLRASGSSGDDSSEERKLIKQTESFYRMTRSMLFG